MLAGRIVAGPLVRMACERHLRDRRGGKKRGLVFDESAATRIIDFFEKFLRLPDVLDEDGTPRPFLLSPWQAFICGSLFGWKRANGYRRFRYAYIETGKGSGKSPLAAGMGLYGLLMDGEAAAEIYAAAVTLKQAKVLFQDAERMVEVSPELKKRIFASVNNLAYQKTMSFFRPVSSEHRALDGPRPHMGFLDEVHEHPTPLVITKIRAGAKGRKQPLFVEITNSGYDRTSICFQHHEQARRVLEGTIEGDSLFAYVCTLDEGDDPLVDRTCWPKTNPGLGVTIQEDYLEEQVAIAKAVPAEMNTVLRLNFCVWTQTHSRFFDMQDWHACNATVSDDELVGAPCYAALDLGESDDLSAFARVWLLDDGRVVARMRYWTPESALERFPNRPYAEWRRAGALEVTEGNITDFDQVEQAVGEDCLRDGVIECRYDKRFAQQMALHLQGLGINMVDQPQGFQLNEALRFFSDAVVEHRFCHGGDPVLGVMASNTVVRHGRHGEIRPDKEKAPEKIDGIVAVAMAIAGGISQAPSESKYERETGLVTIGEDL